VAAWKGQPSADLSLHLDDAALVLEDGPAIALLPKDPEAPVSVFAGLHLVNAPFLLLVLVDNGSRKTRPGAGGQPLTGCPPG
jgi:hypothetical protein